MRVFMIVLAGAVMLGAGSQAQAQPYYSPYSYGPAYVEPIYPAYVEPRVYTYGERRYVRHYGWERGRHYGWNKHRKLVRVCRWRYGERVCWLQARRR